MIEFMIHFPFRIIRRFLIIKNHINIELNIHLNILNQFSFRESNKENMKFLIHNRIILINIKLDIFNIDSGMHLDNAKD